MRLFEAIIEANHRAIAGDTGAAMRPADFADSLPVIALTCIDPRLNPLFPNVMGVTPEDFIWLRNAGNIITSTMSSTMRSLALACAIKGGREIAIIGHTDCRIGQSTMLTLVDRFKALGIPRQNLPDNLNEYFGLFASERQNVIDAVNFVRKSPLIGPSIPVHGLLVDIQTGALEWLVNGYEVLDQHHAAPEARPDAMPPILQAANGELIFPNTKLGDVTSNTDQMISEMHGSHTTVTHFAEPPIEHATLPPQGIPPVVKMVASKPMPPPVIPRPALKKNPRR